MTNLHENIGGNIHCKELLLLEILTYLLKRLNRKKMKPMVPWVFSINTYTDSNEIPALTIHLKFFEKDTAEEKKEIYTWRIF